MNLEYKVEFVDKEAIAPAFGYAKNHTAFVRRDLRPAVKQFVLTHELYHLQDKAVWGGWLGKEIRANISATMKHPLGFVQTVILSLKPDRIRFYIHRARRKL